MTEEKAERFFDPWLTLDPGGPMTEALGRIVLDDPARLRKRSARELENIRKIIITIAANLARAIVTGLDPPTLAVLLARPGKKQSIYGRRGFRQLSAVLERLHAAGFVALRKSRKKGFASTVRPTQRFSSLMPEIGGEAFLRAEGEQVIVLSRAEIIHVTQTRTREWKEYKDTDETRRYRREVERINQALATADLRYEGGHPDVAPRCRTLRRIFNIPQWMPEDTVCFDYGGRLYHGWWVNLDKERRDFIRIDGEPIADLDFQGMFAQLAYIRAGEPMPPGDPYALPGYEGCREGVKKTFNAMLSRKGPLTRLPRGTRSSLPPDCSGKKLRADIRAHHPKLRSVFETGAGLQLMFRESQIMIAILLRLIDLGIVALPMHDGLMVAQSKAATAMKVMGEVAKERTGHTLVVVEKAPRTQ